jgi:Zn-finger in ubiquitin-hydrolases and other protein
MRATCSHLDQIRDVGAGMDVCPSCVEIGATWVHLRQCLICGQTGCCDSSPNKHASAHFVATTHPVMRSLEPGEDWAWCFVDRESMRPDGRGGWSLIDVFFETGLWYANEAIEAGVPLPFEPDLTTPDQFPLGVWATTYGGRHRDGTLDPEQAAEMEALPGWRW